MMIILMVASHILIATIVAVMMAALSSGKVRDLELSLQEERASRAEIVRRHNRIVASYGLAEPLAGAGVGEFVPVLSTGLQPRSELYDIGDVVSGALR